MAKNARAKRTPAQAPVLEMGVYENFDGCMDADTEWTGFEGQLAKLVRNHKAVNKPAVTAIAAAPVKVGQYENLDGCMDADVDHLDHDRQLGHAIRLVRRYGKPVARPMTTAPVSPAKRVNQLTYTMVENVAGVTLPKQARQIVDIIQEAGSIDKRQLLETMAGVIATRQPIERILAFYQRRLIDEGFIRISK